MISIRAIPLTQELFALVDAEDYEKLNKHKWCVQGSGKYQYASRGVNGRTVLMHRVIMDAPEGMEVDHDNHYGLDNRKSNLRVCRHVENLQNQKHIRGRYKPRRVDMKYTKVFQPNHLKADVTGHVNKHILVAEEYLGRSLQKGEIVHHKDFNKQNCKLSNLLFPITRREHQQLPEFQAKFIIMKGLYDEFLSWWHEVKEIARVEQELAKEKAKLERLKECV